ncbi:hypothetical protein LEP1GSC186_2942 [Leptospira noguchii serovar Autumnalis str. ZUN142]|uniref:Uncharacterized protein n=1 Tax=Leptospira noguchii serovar Autumnalis str. ZUN142 TaxID=1085540 RepID=M6UEA1_9LEPT|nr:hypothetical protein LEP1GSC186_2942 [Leptospira noguchii serovar Autumnalis str. ZUN142]
MKDNDQLFNQMKNTEGVKDIIKNFLYISPQERNIYIQRFDYSIFNS